MPPSSRSSGPSPAIESPAAAEARGTRTAVTATTASVAIPPSTTDGTVPSSLAATPDSNAPISLELPMKMALTDETRPSRCSGVSTWSSVLRTTTLTGVHHPARGRARTSDSAKLLRQPEHDHRDPEQRHVDQQRPAGPRGAAAGAPAPAT